MVNMLVKYGDINKQNLKGTTCLWIACCNRHIDVVMTVLENNADPNLANFKGDSPLIPACQKGADSIVELLLENGADLNSYNKNRDSPVLICCRTGQAKILEILLKTYSKDDLVNVFKTFAEIDGFVPLLAATELDKCECIKVCVKYGADLGEKTTSDNKIIPGASAVHLATFYGRVGALKVLHELGADMVGPTQVSLYTPLHIAIKQGHKDATRYLLSIKEGKECLQIKDSYGRLPMYYAKKEGNESLYEDFFTNKLEKILGLVMYSNNDVEEACAKVLVNYGQSLGCYEYKEIVDIMCSNGSSLFTNVLLHNNKHLIDSISMMSPNLELRDDYGLTPLFWKAYLGYDLFGAVVDEDTGKSLSLVFDASKKSMQNKMLLNLVSPSKILTLENDISLLSKMKDGYNLKVNNTVLAILNDAKGMEHSLLGFVDKLKNGKVFPQGKQYWKILFGFPKYI
jgi:ankyrin repeat protein